MISTVNVVPLNRPEPELEPKGFAAASKAWLERWHRDRELTDAQRRICVEIYLKFNTDHFKETGELKAWPSWEYLIEKTGLKRSCVAKSLQGLEDHGAFEIVRGPYNHEENKRGYNEYIVRTSKVHVDGPSKGEQGPRSDEQGPRQGGSKVHAGITIIGEGTGESRIGEFKKEEGLKNGNSRKEEPLSSDSPKPSSPLACEVPRPTTVLPPEFQKWLQGLPRMPRTRFWDQRRPEDTATLERYRRAANGSAGAIAVSS